MKKIFDKINNFKNIFLKFLLLKNHGIYGLNNSIFYGFPLIKNIMNGKIIIGNNFVSISNEIDNIIGINHRNIIRTISDDASIIIGDNVGASGVSIIANKYIKIGNGVLLGANVSIIDNDFHPINSLTRRFESIKIKDSKDVIIEDNVFIGMNSIILKGSYIGKNSVIGANSVVSGKIEENSIYGGNPARFIKKINF